MKFCTLILVCICFSSSVAQEFTDQPEASFFKYDAKLYKDFYSVGDSLNRCRNGTWKDVSVDSVVYRVGAYYDCEPIGEWQLFYPNGDLRMSKVYDSLGVLINWSRYYEGTKIIEIYCSRGISKSLHKSLSHYESQILNNELSQFTSNISHTSESRIIYDIYDGNRMTVHNYSYYSSDFEPVKAISRTTEIIQTYTGRYGVKLWDIDGKLVDEFYFKDGLCLSRINYEYMLKRLKKRKIYRNGELALIEYFNKNGDVTNTKRVNMK